MMNHICICTLLLLARQTLTGLSRKSIVAKSRLTASTSSTLIVEDTPAKALSAALGKCERVSWCTSVCQYTDTGTFSLTNFVITGGIVDTKPGLQMECYTDRPPTIFPSPSIAATATTGLASGTRAPGNMLDGVYGMNINECFLSYPIPYPYLLIDFGTPKFISRALIRIQSEGSYHTFKDIKFYAGNVVSSGDFSTYSLFAEYDGPPDGVNEELEFTKNGGIIAQFFAVQRDVPWDAGMLQFCHLEIY